MDQRLLASIRRHEGWRDKAYQDSEGIWTIGYGTNLQELQIDKPLGERWLVDKVSEAYEHAQHFPEYESLDTVARRNVFIEMIYNMGPSRVAGFKNMLAAIRESDWTGAAAAMLDSRWARQVGIRANRLADLMLSGTYTEDENKHNGD